MSADSVKILTVGSAAGSVRDLLAKITAIDAKHGKFDMALCLGDFFGPPAESETEEGEGQDEVSQLLNGMFEVSVECYIMQGKYPLPQKVVQKFAKTGGQLCKNVFLLSKSALMTTISGLRIACLGGTYDEHIYGSAEAAPGFLSPHFSTHTVERLLANTLSTSSANKNYQSLAAIQSGSSSSQAIDILLTNAWPSRITNFSACPISRTDLLPLLTPPLDEVIRRIQPKYHFAMGAGTPPTFWEREPLVWEDAENRTTRFVSLGAFGGEAPSVGKKQRWFYAFSIAKTPLATTSRPANATKNPFLESAARGSKRAFDSTEGENFIFGNVRQPVKRTRTVAQGEAGKPPPNYKCRRCESSEHFVNDCPERPKPDDGYVCKICNEPGHFVRDCPTRDAVGDTGGRKPKPGYICRACGSEDHYIDDCLVTRQSHGERHGGRKGPPKEIAPDECWFCLSNPNLAKHLIVSIGNEVYMTLPKGQIVATQSAADHVNVPGGGHVLIVPITHYPTFSTIPPDLAPPIVDETEKYKTALRAFFAKHGCSIVMFEVGRLSAKGGHAHVQAVPIPRELESNVEEAFLREGRTMGIDFEADAEEAMNTYAGGKCGYFKVDLPDGRKMVHLMRDRVPFNLQFGRQVLVSLLNVPERMDWKSCTLSEEEDRADAQAFKTAFAPFDPSL